MVGLVIETPLAEDDIGARVLHSANHVCEIALLHLLKTLVVRSALDLETVLGLGLGGLEWAGEDAHLRVSVNLVHLRVGELLVENDTLDEAGIFERTTSLGDDFDKVEVDITSLQVGNVEHGLESEVSVVFLALADDLGAEGSSGARSQLSVLVLEDIELLLDLLDSTDGNVTSSLETISNFKGVDASIQKFLGLLEDSTGEDDDTSGAITDFIILGRGKLSQKTSGLMMDL